MDSRLQHRVQRDGWDLAATAYEPLWQDQLAAVQSALPARAAPKLGERVLDVACGTGLVALPAARAVGPNGQVHGVDIAERMVDTLRTRAVPAGLRQVAATRMDAQQLLLPDGGFDVVLCALGLMYVHDPAQALREMRRVLRPGGRAVLAVWGARTAAGPRCSRSSTPKSAARCVRCSSVSASRARYLEAIAPWRDGAGYRIPAEYVVVELLAPSTP